MCNVKKQNSKSQTDLLEQSGLVFRILGKYGVLLLLFLLGCRGKQENSPAPPDNIEQTIMKFELTETVQGITNFHLEADKALLYENRTVVYGVTLSFYKKGAHYASLTSDSGILTSTTNDMEAMGNVEVVGTEGARLRTETLKWMNAVEKIRTEDKVTITTKDNKRIEGYEFESDPGLTHIKLKQTRGYGE
jgi:LPS export ABC transporter protein LptC